MTDTVTLFTAEPVRLFFMVSEPDPRYPDKHILSTYHEGHLIARQCGDLSNLVDYTALAGRPRPLMYIGWEEEPGIVAYLYALGVEDEPWKPESERDLIATFLGMIVRAREFRVAPDSLLDECTDHFSKILGGKTCEPIEQLMKRLA